VSAGGFLSRWSKRKLAASLAAACEPAAAEAGATAHAAARIVADPATEPPASVAREAQDRAAIEAALPPVEDLTLASDFTAFLKEEVSESLRRQALKKLFADPHFNQMDGLDIYIDDYSIADPIPPSMMEKLKHAREWLSETEAPVDESVQAADGEVLPPVAEGEAVQSGTVVAHEACREVQVGLDTANTGDLVSAEEVEAEAAAWRAETRRKIDGAAS